MQKDFSLYIQRREELKNKIRRNYPNKKGVIVLFAGFEDGKYRFRQESSFYYYTGLEEPGVALTIDLDGPTFLYAPAYTESRSKWVLSQVYGADQQMLKKYGIDQVHNLGQPCSGYAFSCLFSAQEYENFVKALKKYGAGGYSIYTLYPEKNYQEQRLLLERIEALAPDIKNAFVDISAVVASMRRTKNQAEVEKIFKSVDCTMAAFEAAATLIEPEKREYQVQAGIDYIFTETQASPAFPSIVASGKNSTVLHYNKNNSLMKAGDLCLIDMGAEIDYYCADLSRTFPVSGKFSKRQREIYKLVLKVQEEIAEFARPGVWICNNSKPEQSLYHRALKLFEKAGYAKYFTHGIGHYLGMDIHDVGDYSLPLAEGDVITIEPGLYIPEEKIGIRIEDNYWLIKDGVVCLSEQLPKDPDVIEEMMAEEIQECEDEDCDDENCD